MNNSNVSTKLILKTILFGILAAIAAGAMINAYDNANATNASTGYGYVAAPTPTPFAVDYNLAQVGGRIGLTYEQLSEAHAQIVPTAAICGSLESLACYVDGAIYVPSSSLNQNQNDLNLTLAHEYYHYVWANKLTSVDKMNLSTGLNQVYNGSDHLGYMFRWRMQPYINSGYVPGTDRFTSELHSVFCTEVTDNEMSPQWFQYCSRWVPNRNAIPSDLY